MIAHAVQRYLRFALNVRDVEARLAARGIVVSYATVRRGVATCGAQDAEARRRRAPGGRGRWTRGAGGSAGGCPGCGAPSTRTGRRSPCSGKFRHERRDPAAALPGFRRLLDATGQTPPARITTDQCGSDAAALAPLPERAGVEPRQVRAARRCNTRVAQLHQPTRVRERDRRRFTSAAAAQQVADAFSRVCPLFRPGRHRRRAAADRATLRERVATWRGVA